MYYIFELNGLLIFGLPIWIIIRTITLIKRKKQGIEFSLKSEIITNLFVIYLFILIGITILPISISGALPYIKELSLIQRCNINLVPFVGYFKGIMFYSGFIRGIIRNIVGNLLLLTPFILYLCFKNKKFRSLKSSLTAAFTISLTIEFIQLFTNIVALSELRTVDVEDLILNTLGGIVAYGMFKCVSNIKRKIENSKMKVIEEY